MNLRQRELRVTYADHLRARALHDVTRLREALACIAETAEQSKSALVLPDIARIARTALVGSVPADPSIAQQDAKQ
ncbi:hypothetical protein [Paraburkholderia caribensis]|uniref:hypothetical protein n=1 Tax=Paraburkholderia caribensis TaxID=75105 RepID=UPI00285ED0CB|nr:hypothetical protein [Paraburkholderia caribensis]MDR6384951.1 hypothetical protein [Paraburkholderia caribensis]